MTIRAYHFVSNTLRDGRPIPPDGEWLEETGKLEICRTGLHASKHVADALSYAPGTTLCLVELGGDIIEQPDKVCARRRKILARFDATFILRCYARFCARSVLHLWNAPDVVKRYLETGDESLRKEVRASAHAYASASYAAAYAAYAAASSASYAADAAASSASYAADAADAAASSASYAAAYASSASYAAANAAYATYAAASAADAAANAAVGVRQANRDKLQSVIDAEFAKYSSAQSGELGV